MIKALSENLLQPARSHRRPRLIAGCGNTVTVLGLVIFISSVIGRSQTLDSFNPSANNGVEAIGVLADDSIIVGGGFTTLASQVRHRLGRMNVNGILDQTFSPNVDPLANGFVYGLAIQDDGKLLIAGSFTAVGTRSGTGVARLNADGSVDTNFNAVANNIVYAVALQPDGKILLGGTFTTLGNQTSAL